MTTSGVDGACIIRVFRCTCGKIHCCAGVGPNSVCACSRLLYLRMWEAGR